MHYIVRIGGSVDMLLLTNDVTEDNIREFLNQLVEQEEHHE